MENNKKNILVIIDPLGKNLVNYFENFPSKVNIFFLTYKKSHRKKTIKNGTLIFWDDFASVFDLIEKILPNKVVFFELETLNQVILNFYCKNNNITTYFIDHGFQDFEISIKANLFVENKISTFLYFLNKTKERFLKLNISLKNRLFYTKSNSYFSKEERKELRKFKNLRLGNTILNTLSKTKSDFIIPNYFICFSEYNFRFYTQLYPNHNLNENVVTYIGIPEFDDYFPVSTSKTKNKYVLFIDQPYVLYNYYGWNQKNKASFISDLSLSVSKQGRKLIVKKHPLEESFWENVELKFEFISNFEFKNSIANFDVVIGYNSTLLLLFASNKDTYIFCLKNHPIPNNVIPPLIKAGIADWIEDNYTLSFNTNRKINYDEVKKLIYKFDGKSKERLSKIILDETSMY